MSVLNVHSFVEKLKDSAFRAQVAPDLLFMQEGDWQAVSQLAAQHGFEFTEDELKSQMKVYWGFFKGAGQNPESGWSDSTLSEA
ncbi:MAG: Nif11 family protein [Phormidesmis sp. RL_2_1]|nr:Nif11 family protein [Phormidesmis sp. RL_2_1]